MALHVLRTGYDTNGINRLQPNVPEVFLHLRFKDPQNNVLDFPRDLPVIVEFGGNVNHRFEGRTQADGKLRFTLDQNPGMAGGINTALPQNSPLRAFTLVWDLAQMHYIVCNGTAPVTTLGCTNTITPGSPPYQADSRYFGLPRRWVLKQTDIDPAPTFGAGDGVWDPAKATITLQRPTLDQDVGTEAAPVVLVLKLYWHFFRFEFFDRRWGHEATHNNQRVSIPPIRLKGYRANNPAVADPAETDSNWTIPVAGSAAQEVVQCLPWMLRYNTADPRQALAALTGTNMGLLFETAAGTFVHCQSDTNRLVLNIPANDARLDPKAERLDYYDLPAVWKSRGYYTRIGAGGKFFQGLTDGEVAAATTAANRLAFSLDDLVLTNDALAPILLEADHRVALFHHKFSNQGANYSDEGLFELGADPDPTNWQGYPYSNPATVNMLEALANYDAAAAAGRRYYVHVYPNWTRLVLAQGNLFDVFDRRTPDGAAVVGARAAARWVDATTGTYGVAAGNALAPRPAIVLKPANDARATFAIQTYYEQQFLIGYGASWNGGNPEVGPKKHIEFTTRYGTEQSPIGRFDIAVLRCTDRDGNDEVAAVVRYHRVHFDFETADGRANVTAPNQPNPFRTGAAPAPPVTRAAWMRTAFDNLASRWNGHAGDPCNTSPALILPQPLSPPQVPPALKVKIVNVFQAIRGPWAHYDIITITPNRVPPEPASAVGAGLGSGHLRVNCTEHDGGGGGPDTWNQPRGGRGLASAHEMGHSGTLPDDYVADGQLYAHLNLLGAPYVFDANAGHSGLMQYNWEIRARYLWHAAEWLRLLPAFSRVKFKVQRNPDEPNYFVPHYPHDLSPPNRRPRNFVNWPLSFNVWACHGGKSLFDAVLWILGEDKYSTDILRTKIQPVRAGRVDGILIVIMRIEVDLSTVTAGLRAETLRDFHTPVKTAVDNLLNFKRDAAFSLLAAGGDPSFTRCYLHFMVSMIQAGHALLGSTHPHIKISFDPAASPPLWNPDASPPANAKTLRLQLPANFGTLAQANRQNLLRGHAITVRDRIVEALGLDQSSPANPMYYLTPSAYRGFIRAVTEPGIGPPNVT